MVVFVSAGLLLLWALTVCTLLLCLWWCDTLVIFVGSRTICLLCSLIWIAHWFAVLWVISMLLFKCCLI